MGPGIRQSSPGIPGEPGVQAVSLGDREGEWRVVSWQGTDGPGREIGSFPSVILAPAHSGSRIESVMMDRALGGPPQTQREAAEKKRDALRQVGKDPKRAEWGGGLHGHTESQGQEHRRRGRDGECGGHTPRERGAETQRGWDRGPERGLTDREGAGQSSREGGRDPKRGKNGNTGQRTWMQREGTAPPPDVERWRNQETQARRAGD